MYIVLDILDAFKNSAVGTARIVKNLLHAFIKGQYPTDHFAIYRTEETIPEGSTQAKAQQDKMILGDGKTISIAPINMTGAHFITFEPDSHFKVFGTGYAREVPFKDLISEDIKESAFLVWSTKEGPKNWKRATFDGKVLDFGQIVEGSPLNTL